MILLTELLATLTIVSMNVQNQWLWSRSWNEQLWLMLFEIIIRITMDNSSKKVIAYQFYCSSARKKLFKFQSDHFNATFAFCHKLNSTQLHFYRVLEKQRVPVQSIGSAELLTMLIRGVLFSHFIPKAKCDSFSWYSFSLFKPYNHFIAFYDLRSLNKDDLIWMNEQSNEIFYGCQFFFFPVHVLIIWPFIKFRAMKPIQSRLLVRRSHST